jgi:hypothetical protein
LCTKKISFERRKPETRRARVISPTHATLAAFRCAFASFISRVNAAAYGAFRYDPDHVARAARLCGASRTADGSRPARLSPIAVPLLKRGCIHANVVRGARLYPPPAPTLSGPANRFTTLNRRAAALPQRAR